MTGAAWPWRRDPKWTGGDAGALRGPQRSLAGSTSWRLPDVQTLRPAASRLPNSPVLGWSGAQWRHQLPSGSYQWRVAVPQVVQLFKTSSKVFCFFADDTVISDGYTLSDPAVCGFMCSMTAMTRSRQPTWPKPPSPCEPWLQAERSEVRRGRGLDRWLYMRAGASKGVWCRPLKMVYFCLQQSEVHSVGILSQYGRRHVGGRRCQ